MVSLCLQSSEELRLLLPHSSTLGSFYLQSHFMATVPAKTCLPASRKEEGVQEKDKETFPLFLNKHFQKIPLNLSFLTHWLELSWNLAWNFAQFQAKEAWKHDPYSPSPCTQLMFSYQEDEQKWKKRLRKHERPLLLICQRLIQGDLTQFGQ